MSKEISKAMSNVSIRNYKCLNRIYRMFLYEPDVLPEANFIADYNSEKRQFSYLNIKLEFDSEINCRHYLKFNGVLFNTYFQYKIIIENEENIIGIIMNTDLGYMHLLELNRLIYNSNMHIIIDDNDIQKMINNGEDIDKIHTIIKKNMSELTSQEDTKNLIYEVEESIYNTSIFNNKKKLSEIKKYKFNISISQYRYFDIFQDANSIFMLYKIVLYTDKNKDTSITLFYDRHNDKFIEGYVLKNIEPINGNRCEIIKDIDIVMSELKEYCKYI